MMAGDFIINTGGGKFKQNIGRDLIQGDYYVTGQPQSLAEAVAEVQKILEQLEKSYSTETKEGKEAIAIETIRQIDSNPTLAARILSALTEGSVSAFEQFLNHPAASFVIAALADWQKTKGV
ncbi:hypothetical protein [Nostoc sp. 'Lobaria pulmonaria (5183) cyanobiont']|uniref:hypothetical protein n=1 Tax=Nostoc sp. 'Lobaria pulmonaria (5183) cyanobiont' TaxID=1618022 RepID=UPI001F20D225|nr:hypothetical protein [Nostoc sp. 'Lobaria pulmonaria (5183) cyanobiont']